MSVNGDTNVMNGAFDVLGIDALVAVWPDWAIYCTLGNFSKYVAAIILPKLRTLIGNFYKVGKCFIMLVKSFLGNF